MIKEAISMIVQGIDLSQEEMTQCMAELMEGRITEAQIGSFLTALRMKGESVDEITAAAQVMREKTVRIDAPEDVLDTCGTGGDLSYTFNISTTAALLVAACGVPVAKHGSRSVSSKSGSADVLEALGVTVDLTPAKVEKCLFETGFGFLYAPLFHPSMKYAVGPRREMSIRTIFNILGPITNPAGARRQIVGVFADHLTPLLARVLGNLGAVDAMVFHGEDGLDEITITDGTKVSRFINGMVEDLYIAPEDFGFPRGSIDELSGTDKYENARITMNIFNGEKGTRRNIVVMNAAAGLLVSGRYGDLRTAAAAVCEAIDSGRALRKLEEIKRVSNAL